MIPRVDIVLKVRRTVAAPLSLVWAQLVDVRCWASWGPSVIDVQLAGGGNQIRAGSRGRVLTVMGFWLPFAITDFEPSVRWRWQVCGLPATGHRVRSLVNNRTELVFEVPWIIAPYGVVCNIAGSRIAAVCEHT